MNIVNQSSQIKSSEVITVVSGRIIDAELRKNSNEIRFYKVTLETNGADKICIAWEGEESFYELSRLKSKKQKWIEVLGEIKMSSRELFYDAYHISFLDRDSDCIDFLCKIK